jgi:benzoate-CoA ligase
MNLFHCIFKNPLDSTAIIFNDRSITYGELREETLKTARVISSLGVRRGDRVALLLNDSPEFIEAFIAICSMGAITVPINMALRAEDQRTILSNSRARYALVESQICNSLLTDASETLQHLAEVIVVARSESETERPTLQQLKAETSSTAPPAFPEPDENEPAFILYTSGSTGDPKGAVHRQSDIFYTNATYCHEVLGLTPEDRLFSSSRLPFAYGLGNSFTFPFLNGATSILCSQKPTPQVVADVIQQSKPTIFFGVPVVFNLLLEHHRTVAAIDCSTLRFCVSAGEALPAHLGEEWEKEFGIPVLDAIGSTEMLHMFMSNHLNEVRYGSSGKVLVGYEAQLLNENEEPVKGNEGHLWIKGNSAAVGYWEQPDVSSKTFVNGWVRTGDLYRRDDDGYWYHMGRGDDCFKSSGQWVSPVDVEGALIKHKLVRSVAVVEDFDADGLPCACAFVVCNDVESNLAVIEDELRKLVAQSLPRFKRPKRYMFVAELPYTATGKVQRFKLRDELRRQDK